MKEDYGTLQEEIKEVEEDYKRSCELFPGAPLARSSYMLENTLPYPGAKKITDRHHKYHLGYLYVSAILIIDIIMKKDNCISPDFIPQIEKALKLVLSHSRKIPLEPNEWPVMTEVANRVKEGLPKMKIVPHGQEYKYFSY